MSASEQIIQVINTICEKFGIVLEWSAESIAPYIKELTEKIVRYEIWSSVVWIVVAVASFVLPIVTAKYIVKKFNKDSYDMDEVYFVANITVGITLGIFLCISVSVIICQALDIAKCLTIPDQVVLDYLLKIAGTIK